MVKIVLNTNPQKTVEFADADYTSVVSNQLIIRGKKEVDGKEVFAELGGIPLGSILYWKIT